jgi:16S rRNA (uracil1498-N3)-methyltransferase
MRIPRIYTAQVLREHGRLTLEHDPARHLHQVLRLKPGARLYLFDGSGRDFAARIESTGRGGVEVSVQSAGAPEPAPPLAIRLLLGISKGERMEYAVQKAVELGVEELIPLLTEHTVVKLDPPRLARRLEHWRKVVIGACEQSGRRRLPKLGPPRELAVQLEEETVGVRLVLDAGATASLTDLALSAARVSLLVGPEGGLSERELRSATAAGFVPLRLGPRILRTETAPLAAIAAMQALWGDFRPAQRSG